MSRHRMLFVGFTVVAAVCAAALGLFVGARTTTAPTLPLVEQADEELPVLGQVTDFELTTSTGEPLGLESLAGSIWVADFIFTSCPGVCPLMSSNMFVLHTELDGTDVRFVSFSVDPATDTPEVLAGYAQRFGADIDRWHFLTGPESEIQRVAVEGFKLGHVDEPIYHSSKFVLVDREGAIRGYYDGTDTADLDRLRSELDRLLGAPTS